MNIKRFYFGFTMITLQALTNYLEDLLDTSTFSDYCPNGLQVEGVSDIQKICTGVSASLSTIEAAIEAGAQALITHHGMFWKGDCYRITGTKKKKLQLLFENNISLLSYHLPLDGHQEFGNNWKAAQDLGWQNLTPFGNFQGSFIGVKGSFPSLPVTDFQKTLEEYYCHPAHTAPGSKDRIASAAIISGGAHKSISEAVQAEVDCFITGSFDEPIWHIAKEENIHFFALGHSATETVGPKALGEHLSKQFNLDYSFIDIPNPF